MRDAFAVLFFVSVGMLFDPRYLLAVARRWWRCTLAIIMLGKPLAASGHRPAAAVSAPGRPLGRGGPGADRRILVHPRLDRRAAGPPRRPGEERPDRRGDPLDHAQPPPLPPRRPPRSGPRPVLQGHGPSRRPQGPREGRGRASPGRSRPRPEVAIPRRHRGVRAGRADARPTAPREPLRPGGHRAQPRDRPPPQRRGDRGHLRRCDPSGDPGAGPASRTPSPCSSPAPTWKAAARRSARPAS